MLYCYDSKMNFLYTNGEKKVAKEKQQGILYHAATKTFTDFENQVINIAGQVVLARTGVAQINDMTDEIIRQGGIPVSSKEQLKQVEEWLHYYKPLRKMEYITGKDLLRPEVIARLEAEYGPEIFLKTKIKDFSDIIPISVLKDHETIFSKALEYHPDDVFMISEPVKIVRDNYGEKEYRCVIVQNQIYNISRFTVEVLHSIDTSIIEKLKTIITTLNGKFPDSYVVDLFEYEYQGEKVIDVVEFNNIHTAGLYLYNSIIEPSDDLQHKTIHKIASEFSKNKGQCTTNGLMLAGRGNMVRRDSKFYNDLVSMSIIGIRGFFLMDVPSLDADAYAKHLPESGTQLFSSPLDEEKEMLSEKQFTLKKL